MGRKNAGYAGTEKTNRDLRDLLPGVLKKIGALHEERPDLILAAWPKIVGDKIAPMTRAISVIEGIVTIKVSNSALYSLLSQHEKKRLLRVLRETFPEAGIKNIVFRLG